MADGVQFDEWRPRQTMRDPNSSKLVAWMLNKKVAKNKTQANMILVILATLFFGLALILFLT